MTPSRVLKKYRPNKKRHLNPLQNIYKIVWAVWFFFSPPPAMCVWHIQDEQQQGVSALAWEEHAILSGLLFCMTGRPQYMMAQCDVKVLWVQVQAGFPMLEKGLTLISSL